MPTLENSFMLREVSPDGKWFAFFEDNGETGYMYLGVPGEDEESGEIIEDMWIYNQILPPIEECKEVFLFWSKDSKKVALIVDQECWGIYDLSSWRKMTAPRVENCIKTIPIEIWNKGLSHSNGEKIRPFESTRN